MSTVFLITKKIPENIGIVTIELSREIILINMEIKDNMGTKHIKRYEALVDRIATELILYNRHDKKELDISGNIQLGHEIALEIIKKTEETISNEKL